MPMRRLHEHAARSNSGTTWRWQAVPGRRRRRGPSAPPECPARSHSDNVHGSSNNLPQAVATAAATGADCAGRPRCETSGPVATRDIERVLEQGRDAPVYGPNLRLLPAHGSRGLAAPCARPTCSWPSADGTGRGIAEPLFQAEREAETATTTDRRPASAVTPDGCR
jgi:hypothetical protein